MAFSDDGTVLECRRVSTTFLQDTFTVDEICELATQTIAGDRHFIFV